MHGYVILNQYIIIIPMAFSIDTHRFSVAIYRHLFKYHHQWHHYGLSRTYICHGSTCLANLISTLFYISHITHTIPSLITAPRSQMAFTNNFKRATKRESVFLYLFTHYYDYLKFLLTRHYASTRLLLFSLSFEIIYWFFILLYNRIFINIQFTPLLVR